MQPLNSSPSLPSDSALKCDYCKCVTPAEELDPEKGGTWVCQRCIWQWEEPYVAEFSE